MLLQAHHSTSYWHIIHRLNQWMFWPLLQCHQRWGQKRSPSGSHPDVETFEQSSSEEFRKSRHYRYPYANHTLESHLLRLSIHCLGSSFHCNSAGHVFLWEKPGLWKKQRKRQHAVSILLIFTYFYCTFWSTLHGSVCRQLQLSSGQYPYCIPIHWLVSVDPLRGLVLTISKLGTIVWSSEKPTAVWLSQQVCTFKKNELWEKPESLHDETSVKFYAGLSSSQLKQILIHW